MDSDPTWWCPACRAPRAGDACVGCGMLLELCLRDGGFRPIEPRVEKIRLHARILAELAPQQMPGSEWPWLTYAMVAAAAAFGVRIGVGRLLGGDWVWVVLSIFVISAVVLAIFRRSLFPRVKPYIAMIVRRGRHVATCIVRRLAPRPRYQRRLRVLRAADQQSIEVAIDAPEPWPPPKSAMSRVAIFVGRWERPGLFVADRIIPPLTSGGPMVVASGRAQPMMWIGAILGLVAITLALTE